MPDKIGEITGQSMLSGIFPDLPGKQAPVWTNAKNVIFSDNSVQPIPGQYLLTSGTTGLPNRGLLSTRISGTPTLFFGDDSKLYKYTISGGVQEVGLSLTGGGNLLSFVRWGTWVLATNGVDSPKIFKGVSFATLGGLDSSVFSTCEILVAWRNFVIAMNTDVNDARIAWCDQDDVETWTSSTTNAARQRDIRDTVGGITAGIVYNERIFYLTRGSIGVMDFIGGPDYFSSVPASYDFGAYGKRCVTEADKKLYGFGPNGVWASDGAIPVYIDEGAVHDAIFADFNQDYAYKCRLWNDTFTKHLILWLPADGETENSVAWAFNYKDKNWTKRGDARCDAIAANEFKWGLISDTSGNIYAQSLVDAPVSAQDPVLDLAGVGTYSVPFGQSGFGQVPFGGQGTFTE